MKSLSTFGLRLVVALVVVSSSIFLRGSATATAATSSSLEATVLSYLQSQGYSGANFPNGTFSETLSCPAGRDCLSTGSVGLVPYQISGSDGGGVALVGVGTQTDPNAQYVLIAGGGALDVNSLEAFGLTSAEAQDLYNQFNR